MFVDFLSGVLKEKAWWSRNARNTAVSPPVSHANLPGVRLAYRDSGGSGAPIVLLHANTGTSAELAAAVRGVRGRRLPDDRVRPARLGPEPRPILESGPQPGSVAEDLAALADHLALPPFHLLGCRGRRLRRARLCSLAPATRCAA